MPRGVFERKPRCTAIRETARCRPCGWVWRPTTGFSAEPCPHCGVRKDVRKREHQPDVVDLKKWRAANPQATRERSTRLTREYRSSALLLVGRGVVACVRCRCDRPELLEINHKNGGGAQEIAGRSQQYIRDIVTLKRGVEDLELLCKPCNSVHALELLHGALPFRVVWGSE